MLQISMISLTYANKSKKILENFGYKCDIVHQVKTTGCEYVITVNAPKDVVTKILTDNNIPIKKVL